MKVYKVYLVALAIMMMAIGIGSAALTATEEAMVRSIPGIAAEMEDQQGVDIAQNASIAALREELSLLKAGQTTPTTQTAAGITVTNSQGVSLNVIGKSSDQPPITVGDSKDVEANVKFDGTSNGDIVIMNNGEANELSGDLNGVAMNNGRENHIGGSSVQVNYSDIPSSDAGVCPAGLGTSRVEVTPSDLSSDNWVRGHWELYG